MRYTLILAGSALILATSAIAQPITPSAPSASPASGNTILIQHGRVITEGAQGTLNNADVLIENGKITQVSQNIAPPPGAKVIDAHGKPVTPGLMASWTQLGIVEIDLVSETNDTSPNQAQDSAAFDVADALNPNSTLIPVARIAGVTRGLTTPADCGDVFCGTSAVIDLGNGPDILVKKDAGVVVELEPNGGEGQKNSRPDIWEKFRETMDDAREYCSDRASYHRAGGYRDQRSLRADLDALCPVVQGSEPIFAHVERASTIRQILGYTQANHLKLVVLGGGEAWEVAKDLASAHVPVVIDTEQNLPGSFSDIGATLKNAARLDQAGVVVAFRPQGGTAHYARTVTQIAGNAVANGMNWNHALAALTRNPAEIFGIADSYGTLEPGKDADVVIWNDDPLEVTSAPIAVFIKGANIPLVSRQTRLRDRYRDLSKKPFAYR